MKKIKTLFTKENIVKGLKWFFFSYIWLAILMFIIDIVSKTIVKNNMYLEQSITLIPNFLFIHYTQNNGMAFSFKTGNPLADAIIFISISLIGSIAMIGCAIYFWKKMGQVSKAALMLMISGTVGNLIDRAFYIDAEGKHFVVDFINFRFFGWDFPIFNVADSCLVIGVIMLLIYLVVVDVKQEKVKKAETVLKTQGQVNQENNVNRQSNEENKPESVEIKTENKEQTETVEKEKDEPRND